MHFAATIGDHTVNMDYPIICPVWAMLKPSTPITASFSIAPR